MKTNMLNIKVIIQILIFSLVLSACGGGGKPDNTSNTTDSNKIEPVVSEPNPSTTTIQFVNGFWQPDLSTATVGQTSNGWSHNGLSIIDDYSVNSNYTSVRETDKADGTIGKVMSVYYGNSRNEMSAPIRLLLDSPQTEFWLRFNYRIAAGQTLAGLFEHKILYAFTSGSASVNVNWPGQGDQATLQPRNTTEGDIYYPRVKGWTDLYGSTDASADGTYHAFEFHFSSNGIFQMWVDNELVAESSELDFGGSPFTYIYIPHNHNLYNIETAAHDIDGIKIALPDYPGFMQDASGNNMIGE